MRTEHKAMMKKRKENICLQVAYDGTAYHGFQRQKNCLAIQNVLEEVLSDALGETIEIAGASRTDAGVHARCQVVNFFTDTSIPVERLPKALNKKLPPDIVITAAKIVDREFSALHSTVRKTYKYKVYNNVVPNPFLRSYSWHYPYHLDFAKMQAAMSVLVGKHDFTSFKSSGGAEMRSSVRTITCAQCERCSDDIFLFTISGDGFLYRMVRNIVGTVVTVGNNRMSLERLREVLLAKDRRLAGKTAPAQGLILWDVQY